ncbi:hypothetical protein BC938DRAFT_476240 [Jimgerdemannia flammicorona]|uniref:AAA-ATPase-like domain-containing protein n=1 Tax=Jimgerdemannia flammicorona TaxID=994334 RepID=A0A433PIZ0_9FUNG|nr:hypothetical protein BC938DRAFT_476240 [Jimgerdemannia flammicorona]
MSRLMRTTISQIYNEHTYLREHLNINEKAKFDRIVNEDSSQSFEFALRELMVFLARYHQQKCIVLIDEYDAPISSAYHNGYYEDAMHFLRPMLSSLLKDNINLQRAFMVGILRIGKSDFLSSLNNVDVFPMTRAKYATSFGFTEDEVRLLLEHHNVEIPMSEVTDWYNGYLIGTQDNCHPLFNPWSIVCLCQHRELQPFWNESGIQRCSFDFGATWVCEPLAERQNVL